MCVCVLGFRGMQFSLCFSSGEIDTRKFVASNNDSLRAEEARKCDVNPSSARWALAIVMGDEIFFFAYCWINFDKDLLSSTDSDYNVIIVI